MAPVMCRQDSYRRAERAYLLRVAGRTYQEIADVEGFQTSRGAWLAVQRHLARSPSESTEDQRRSAADGLRIVTAVLFERLAAAAKRKDDETLAVMSKEIRATTSAIAKLNGLAVPVVQKHEVDVRQTTTQIIADARQRLMAVIDAEVVDQKEIAR